MNRHNVLATLVMVGGLALALALAVGLRGRLGLGISSVAGLMAWLGCVLGCRRALEAGSY